MTKNMKKIIIIALILVVCISVVLIRVQNYKISLEEGIEDYVKTYTQEWYDTKLNLDYGATLPFAGSTYNLAGSGITSAATSITLQSLTIPQTGYELLDADLSTTFYITLEPGSKKRQEIVSCTTVVQNANDTATLSGCTRGLLPISPYTTDSDYKFAHAGGSQVIFSDPPQLFNEFVTLSNVEEIAGQKTFQVIQYFDVFPEISTSINATTSNQLVNKQYADNIANQGAATSTEAIAGISELATKAEQALGASLVADAPLVLGSHYASSTPSGGSYSALTVVVSEADGFLSHLWLDLSDSFAFTDTISIAETLTVTKTIYGGFDTPSYAATTTIDWAEGNTHVFVLTGNGALQFANQATSTAIKVFICQDGTGSRLITNWPTTPTTTEMRWAGGFEPTLTTDAGKCDVLSFFTATTSGTVFAAATLDF